jgi:hypothetical protein
MPTYINPDNGRLVIKSNNDINLNDINANDSALHVTGGQYTDGNLYVSGTLVVNGDVVTLGNAGGSLTFNANISSNVLPNTTEQFDIGTDILKWNNIFSKTVNADKMVLTASPLEVIITVDTENSVCHITSNTQSNITLPDGQEGQIVTVVTTETPVLPVSLTPDNSNGFTNIVLTNAGDTVSMLYTNGSWSITSVFRASVS